MGVNGHSRKTMEQIQRENLKRLKQKNRQRVRQANLEKRSQERLEREKREKLEQIKLERIRQMKPERAAEPVRERSKATQLNTARAVQSDCASGTQLKSAKTVQPNKVQHRKDRSGAIQTAGTQRTRQARPGEIRNNVSRKKRSVLRIRRNPRVLAILLVFVVAVFGVKSLFQKDKSSSTDEAVTADAPVETELIEMEARISFAPYATEQTKPENLIQSTEINVNGTTLASVSDYQPFETIDFGYGDSYYSIDGIPTFRGNNFRDSAVFGETDMQEFTLNQKWSHDTSSLGYGDVWWTGSGWTGQPLMAKWPKETKAAMNMYDWAKQDDDLVEVIYACMDGYVYFMDLQTGKDTRDPMYLGYTFKGSGALDPRGYPIMYVGAGYDSNNGTARSFIINLLDCSILYEFGNNDEFSLRGSLSYFDSSALVDAETDTLIYPGENGILYLIKLNTQYDQNAGTLSINPGDIVKWRYYGTRSSTSSYWVGMETSAAVYGGYLFVADNGGNLMCLDLNTLQLVWVQDILDDSNSTPVLSVEDGHLYIYISTSFHLGWRSYDIADIPIWKIDADNGEIVWQTSYDCYTEDALSGGVQSTIALGTNELDDYIYVTVARTGATNDGVLTCLKKSTGEVVWEHEAFYAWSSPVCVYNSEGAGKVIYCTCGGKMYLLDGKTGETHDTLVLAEGAIESSPAVYNDMLVVGTRECEIWGIQLK